MLGQMARLERCLYSTLGQRFSFETSFAQATFQESVLGNLLCVVQECAESPWKATGSRVTVRQPQHPFRNDRPDQAMRS